MISELDRLMLGTSGLVQEDLTRFEFGDMLFVSLMLSSRERFCAIVKATARLR